MCLVKIKKIFNEIYLEMLSNKDYLIELDQKFGDGDLGLSMVEGFNGVNEYIKTVENIDSYPKFFHKISLLFNESAPSSLGTIISYFIMGIAKSLKKYDVINEEILINSMDEGLEYLKEKVKTKMGEKTIIDSLEPAIKKLIETKNIDEAIKAAKEGVDKTKEMIAVHGRAAYHKEKTIGYIDGGAYVAYLIFIGIKKGGIL
ncbi:dihydroxyacetone kinase subunit L [Oceanivirga salmonicida]|uniref:dihydroxyacetone kinase subunit L n=1 Tax=Oceanivirga salmonicida TaxID=1769291 RepID=UPI0012E3166A|nr:dihydroxyacetone kinase subunit L [Oceanivirga salmonicida]